MSFDDYLKNPKPTSFKVDDWVNLERCGQKDEYGLVVDIRPQYLVYDLIRDNLSIQKGDYTGDFILVKKIKLGARIKKPRSECVSAYWCDEVTEEQQKKIKKYFTDNPDRKKIFYETPFELKPQPVPYLFDLTEAQAQALEEFMKTFQEKISVEKIMACLEARGLIQFAIPFNAVTCAKNKVYALFLWENITEYSATHKSHLVSGFQLKPWLT